MPAKLYHGESEGVDTVPLGVRENVEDANWLHLNEGEQVRWTGRPSKYTLVAATTYAILLVFIGVGATAWLRPVVADQGWPTILGYLPLVVALGGIAYAAYTYLNWLRLLYVITDEEIYVKIGLVSRDVTQVPLSRVQNTVYQQSVLERLLSYGDVNVYTAGTHTEDITLWKVPRPERIKGTLTAQISKVHGTRSGASDGL